MSIDKELLEILACPLCKTEVREVREGEGLQCVQCGIDSPALNALKSGREKAFSAFNAGESIPFGRESP